MFPALRSFFLSNKKPLVALKKFFEDPLSEVYFYYVQSVASVFHSHFSEIKAGQYFDWILTSEHGTLEYRKNKTIPLKVKEMIKQLENDGNED